jgi:hypothetical protein
MTQCAIDNCQEEAFHWVTAPNRVTKPVCVKCGPELLALYDYQYDSVIGKGPHGRWEKTPDETD